MTYVVEQLGEHNVVVGDLPDAQEVPRRRQQVGPAVVLVGDEHELGGGVGVLEHEARV